MKATSTQTNERTVVQQHQQQQQKKKQWDVNRYENQHSFVWEYGASLIDVVDPQPGERILDVGCGTGTLTLQLCQRGARCIGMDSDERMIERAQQQYPEIPFFLGDIRSMENWAHQLPGKVDVVFSNAALHWIPREDSNDALQTISNVIRPGGRFIAEFGGKGNVDYIVRAVQEVLLHKLDIVCPNPWYFPSIAEYSSLLERHGIEVTSAELYDRPTLLEDGEQGLSNWIRMFGNSFLDGLSDDDVTMVLAAVDDKLRSALFDGEQWTADYRRLRIIGRKLND